MPYVILVLCALVCTFFIARFFAAKTRLVEKAIEETIARKLSSSPPAIELQRLKEENGVMRNLLIDMVENEASASLSQSDASDAEQAWAIKSRALRRRELFGEAIFVLQQAEKSRTLTADVKIHG